jgi:hypothetical protein
MNFGLHYLYLCKGLLEKKKKNTTIFLLYFIISHHPNVNQTSPPITTLLQLQFPFKREPIRGL